MMNLNLANDLVTTMCDIDNDLACQNRDDLLTETLAAMETPEGLKCIIAELLTVIEDIRL